MRAGATDGDLRKLDNYSAHARDGDRERAPLNSPLAELSQGAIDGYP